MSQARECILSALSANVGCMLIGDPGVGKSALAKEVSEALSTPLGTLIGSTLDPTDVGGLPVVRVDGKGIDRVPLALIQRLCREPGILFLDEIACAPPAVQAAMLRLILERVAGDEELHPDTRVIAATNPPEQSPGGSDLSAPLIGRVMLLHLRPSHDEVVNYFEDVLGAAGDTTLAAEALDFAATARCAGELLEIDIPEAAVSGNIPWGAPRAWERVVRLKAAMSEKTPKGVVRAAVAGNVGMPLATAYSAILDLRGNLPTIDDICRDPKGAKMPEDKKHQIGAVGLIARVAERDKWAGYIYADRLGPELRAACGKMLGKKKGQTPGEIENDTSPHRKDGALARLNILKSIPRSALGGR
jgi:MoxR-like ATPase